jgi:hypothetical protein
MERRENFCIPAKVDLCLGVGVTPRKMGDGEWCLASQREPHTAAPV